MVKVFTDFIWSHFEDKEGNKLEQVFLDGGKFVDPILQGIVFVVKVNDNNNMIISIHPKSVEQYKKFNADYWFDVVYQNFLKTSTMKSDDDGLMDFNFNLSN